MQGIVGAPQLLFIQQPSERVQTSPAQLLRHVGGIQPRGDGLALHLADNFHGQVAAALYLCLVRVELLFHKAACGFHNEGLFLG